MRVWTGKCTSMATMDDVELNECGPSANKQEGRCNNDDDFNEKCKAGHAVSAVSVEEDVSMSKEVTTKSMHVSNQHSSTKERSSSSSLLPSSPFKRPPSPSALVSLEVNRVKRVNKRYAPKVLDEDEYEEQMANIITRDFFPLLHELRTKKGKRESGKEINGDEEKRPDTDLSVLSEWEPQDPVTETKKETTTTSGNFKKQGLGLDAFLASHTSEDNASFYSIAEEERRAFEAKNKWLFKEDEQQSTLKVQQSLKLPEIQVQATQGSDEKPRTLDTWQYRNVNNVFYPPEGLEFTPEEVADNNKKQRTIVHENTRFNSNPWKAELQDSSLKQSVLDRAERSAGKIGADGREVIDSALAATPAIQGYKFVKPMPSPIPGVEMSPLMTWGQIESTPQRLQGNETPLLHGGPKFSIQATPRRDRIAHQLAEKNAKFYRDKKNKAMERARSNVKTPRQGLSERVATMSPAAQRLATHKLGIRLGTDKSLKAAYTPSPMRRKEANTPIASVTPGSSRRKSKSDSGVTTPIRASKHESLTDDLLSLPKSDRKDKSEGKTDKSNSGTTRLNAAHFFSSN